MCQETASVSIHLFVRLIWDLSPRQIARLSSREGPTGVGIGIGTATAAAARARVQNSFISRYLRKGNSARRCNAVPSYNWPANQKGAPRLKGNSRSRRGPRSFLCRFHSWPIAWTYSLHLISPVGYWITWSQSLEPNCCRQTKRDEPAHPLITWSDRALHSTTRAPATNETK